MRRKYACGRPRDNKGVPQLNMRIIHMCVLRPFILASGIAVSCTTTAREAIVQALGKLCSSVPAEEAKEYALKAQGLTEYIYGT